MDKEQNMGFGPKKKKNSKVYFQCGYFEKENEQIYFCYYNKRKDHHEECHGQHKHEIKEKKKNGPLDEHINRRSQHDLSNVYEAIGHYVAVSNSSLISGSSCELFNIIYEAINFIKKKQN